MLLKETQEKLLPTLKTYFGYDSFRDQQQAIIESVLSKKDNIVIMPTGGGKSICFQLPALLFEGVTLVISPLIALMKDQVDGLKANGIAADFYNSSQEKFEQEGIFEKVFNKEIKLLYVAPESLSLLENILSETYISFVAIDDAHCISSWGHDFRPSYQQLGFLKQQLPNTPIIALTATADKATRKDILQQLNIPKNANNFLPSGTLAAAVAGTRRNERKRPSRETSKPKSAYDLFVLERKVKYPNMGNTKERRQLIRQERYNETEEGRKKYEKKR